MKRRLKVFCAVLLAMLFLHSTTVCADPLTSDIIANTDHEPITWELIRMVEHDSALKSLLIQSIEQANAMNPDRNANPVDSCLIWAGLNLIAVSRLPKWQVTW